ncbi:hypothetical protein KUCAC02_013919, partial [Chaenocephalus aceratus]
SEDDDGCGGRGTGERDSLASSSSSSFISLPAAFTQAQTTLTSHSGYHAQQCLTKTLACTSRPQP